MTIAINNQRITINFERGTHIVNMFTSNTCV